MAIKAKNTSGAANATPEEKLSKIDAMLKDNAAKEAAANSPQLPFDDDTDVEIPAFLRRTSPAARQQTAEAVTAEEVPEAEVKTWNVDTAEAAAGVTEEAKIAPSLPPVDGVAVKGKISRKTKEVVVAAAPAEEAPVTAVVAASASPITVNGQIIGTPQELLEQAKLAYANFSKSNWALGEALMRIADFEVLPALGYTNDTDGFRKMLKDKIGISYETARTRIRVVKYFRDNNLAPELADQIGWSKAFAIVDTPSEKLPQLLAYVENPEHTVDEVAEAARLYKRKDEPGRAPLQIAADPATAAGSDFIRKKLVMTKDDADLVQGAIDTARARYSEPGKEVTETAALRIMATEWASNAGYKVGLAEEIKAIEAKYGVLLRVVGADEQPHVREADDAAWEGAKP